MKFKLTEVIANFTSFFLIPELLKTLRDFIKIFKINTVDIVIRMNVNIVEFIISIKSTVDEYFLMHSLDLESF